MQLFRNHISHRKKVLLSCVIHVFLILSTYCDDQAQSKPDLSAPDSPEQPDYAEEIKRDLKEAVMMEIDSDKDGQVSYEELKKYLAQLHEKNIQHNVDKQWVMYSPQIHEVYSWEGYEPEKMEVLTWDHYFNQTYPELVGQDIGIPIVREQDTGRIFSSSGQNEGKSGKGEQETKKDDDEDPQFKLLKTMALRADARWKLADENGDTLLTKQEFKYLLHPDEGHEELQKLFVQEATEDMDLNKDGKIDLDEFMKHLQILASDQERMDQSWLFSQQENFGRFLDKNKDGSLDEAEIKNWLIPAKKEKFDLEATRLQNIGDQNDDSRLSIVEILQNYEQYLSLLPSDYWQAGENSNNSTPNDNDSSGDGRDEL